MTLSNARQFFEEHLGSAAQEFYLLPQSGSARRNYFAETQDACFIVTYNENSAENESFFYFSDVFSELNLPAPAVVHISSDRKMYIQQSVGHQTLSEIIAAEGQSGRVGNLVKKVLTQLVLTQQKTTDRIDYSKTFEYQAYDELPITSDLFYFKSFIVDVLEIPHQKATLLKEFAELTAEIAHLEPRGIMMRDFQARNIMINTSDQPFFIDYQAAMYGPLMYDVVSFLFQAKANFSPEFRSEMLNHYFSLWEDEKQVTQLKSCLLPLQLIRYLQVLGAYGFRGLIQQKPHFLASIDTGIKNLADLAAGWGEMEKFPELRQVISRLNDEDTQQKITTFRKHSFIK